MWELQMLTCVLCFVVALLYINRLRTERTPMNFLIVTLLLFTSAFNAWKFFNGYW